MKRWVGIYVVVFMFFGMLGVANASSILYFVDYNIGTDYMAQALSESGNAVTTATDSTDFATKIANGTYDLGIFMVQNYSASSYGDGISALATFVANGGRSIYTDWSLDNTYAAMFGVAWSGGSNQSTITVTDASLATNILGPISLTNPGWGIYSMDVTGTIAATFENGNGAIAIGNNGSSITNGFLTDTFVTGAEGVQLYKNEIAYLTNGSTPTPIPAAVWLLGSGLLGLVGVRRKIRK